MTPGFKFQKASQLDNIGQIKSWPKLASTKIDGYRTIVMDAVALSSNLTPVKNKFIQSILGNRKLNGLDGEVVVGPPWGDNVIGKTSSGLKRTEGEPDFYFHVFDDSSAWSHSFTHRIGRVEDRVEDFNHPRVLLVPHTPIHSAAGLTDFEKKVVLQGYEGVVLRCPNAPYKYGRSTELEDTCWKVKRFEDAEALVISLEEGEINQNPATVDALGHLKRSSAKEGKVKAGRVGTIVGRDVLTGLPVRIAPGNMTAAQRIWFWEHPDEIVDHLVTYKRFAYGGKDMDRHPTFKVVRPRSDMAAVG